MEKPEEFLFDRKSESTLLDQIGELRGKMIEIAKEQLETIEPALRDLISKIVEEKPDYVVFLDKGARLFGTPFKQYLSGLHLDKNPEVRFYNDDATKGIFLKNESLEEIAKKDFSDYEGKKVFFIDETFSSGKGALALRSIIDLVGIDGKYFALSQDSKKPELEQGDNFYSIPRKEYDAQMTAMRQDDHFTIYENKIDILFSKGAAELYVTDDQNLPPNSPYQRTLPRYQSLPSSLEEAVYDYSKNKGEAPSPRKYAELPEGMTWRQYDDQVRQINFETVKKLKEMIYETLLKIEPDREASI